MAQVLKADAIFLRPPQPSTAAPGRLPEQGPSLGLPLPPPKHQPQASSSWSTRALHPGSLLPHTRVITHVSAQALSQAPVLASSSPRSSPPRFHIATRLPSSLRPTQLSPAAGPGPWVSRARLPCGAASQAPRPLLDGRPRPVTAPCAPIPLTVSLPLLELQALR